MIEAVSSRLAEHIQSISKNYYQWKNAQELTTWNNTFVPIYQG